MLEGQNAQALLDLDKCIAINPEYGEAYLNRGILYEHLDDIVKACENWEIAAQYWVFQAEVFMKMSCGNEE